MFTFVRVRLALSLSQRSLPPFHLFSLASRLEETCRGSSLYEELYGRRIPDDPVAVKRFQKPSSPLVLTPPVLPSRLPSPSHFHLEAVLIGSSTVHAGSVIARLIPLLEASCSASVEGVSLSGIYHQQEIPFGDLPPLMEIPLTIISLDDLIRQLEAMVVGAGARLRFITPLKLVRQGRILQRVIAADILRFLLRRTSSLAYHYCQYEFPVDYRYLSELAAGISCDSSGVNPYDEEGRGGEGLVGDLVLRGDLEPFLPFLAAGSVVHLGKGAASGYGCYELLPVD